MRVISSVREKKLIISHKNRYFSVSPYGKVTVTDTVENGVNVRLLLVNGTRESATYLAQGLRNEPVFEYIRRILYMTEKMEHRNRVLLIGGAGFSLPKKYIATYPDGVMDVVEHNPEMVELAKHYFFLDELYEQFDLEETKRLNVYIDDGYRFLEHTPETYDLIINDAYVGRVADRALSGADGCRLVYDHLRPGGTYLANVITARTGSASMPGIMAEEMISRVFGKAAMIPVYPDYDADKSQNVIIRAEKQA